MRGFSLDDMILNSFKSTENGDDKIMAAIMELLQSNNYAEFQTLCMNVMRCLDLGRLEKGSLLFDTKQKLFQQRWMSMKKKNHGEKPVNEVHDKNDILERDSLISLHCKQRDNATIEEYRVVYPFVK